MAFYSLEQKCALLERISRAAHLSALLDLLGDEIDKLGLVDGYLVNLCDLSSEFICSLKIRFPVEFRYLEKTYSGYRTSLHGDMQNTSVRAFKGRRITRLNFHEGPEAEKKILSRWKMDECAAMPLVEQDDLLTTPIGTILLLKQQGHINGQTFRILTELLALFVAPLRRARHDASLQDFHDRFQNAASEHTRALKFLVEINNLTQLEKIFAKFARHIFRQVAFECISFYLLEDDVLQHRMVACADARYQQIERQVAQYMQDKHYELDSLDGGVPHAFLKNASLMFHDVQELLHIPMSDKDTHALRILQTPRTLLILPIRYQGKPIGCIAFFSLSRPIDVPSTDLSLLEKLSDFLGTAIINSHNVELRQVQNAELERLATHDVLTGLPNRALLLERLQQGLARWKQLQQQTTVAFIDLDHFKNINDTLGHSAGDRALVAVTKKLRACLQEHDTLARFGGDEFVLILEGPNGSNEHGTTLQRVLVALSEPIQDVSQELTMTCSIGFSQYPQDGSDVDTLLNAADTAMYQAKELGRSNIQRYTPDMRIAARQRLTMESKLRQATENNELILHYQPKLDLRTGSVVGVEALVRWQHPELGIISPNVFIPIAEETGLIVSIGDWILRTACKQALAWQKAGIGVPIAVNLSAKQFQAPGIAASVKETLESIGFNPRYLELELTESMSMGNPEKSIEIMQSFKTLGITLTIDDFGTGYSNLSYLKRFPVDKLKLDQSFVRDITYSPEALAISQAVLAIARTLNLKVVVEGVETQAQLDILAKNHCQEVQGYYFSRPLPFEQCTLFLQQSLQRSASKSRSPALAAPL